MVHEQNIVFKAVIAIIVLVCGGCLGSSLLHDDDNQPIGTFGDLHTVPERPTPPDIQEFNKIKQDLEHR